MHEEYPKKVLTIYGAVGRLIDAGRNLEKITVSEITREAGIGKGTAYEYFGSKEEIISRAVCFLMHQTMLQITTGLEEAETLREQLDLILEWTEKGLYANIIYDFLKLQMNQAKGAEEMHKLVEEMTAVRDRFINQITEVLLKTGIREGLIEPQQNPVYAQLVMTTAIVSLIELCANRERNGSFAVLSRKEFIDDIIKIMTRSLNFTDREY